ncbi:hypothetical protein ACJX0J_010914, partial [Zea mays]
VDVTKNRPVGTTKKYKEQQPMISILAVVWHQLDFFVLALMKVCEIGNIGVSEHYYYSVRMKGQKMELI